VVTVHDTDRSQRRREHREGQLFAAGATSGESNRMEKALWYLLTATRGGANRARIIDALSERPMNANELADELDVGYKTIRHHMEQLEEHDVVESGEETYAKLYFLTDRFEKYEDTFEEIVAQMDT